MVLRRSEHQCSHAILIYHLVMVEDAIGEVQMKGGPFAIRSRFKQLILRFDDVDSVEA